MIFGIPLLFFLEKVMPFLGWVPINPTASRIVGAALMGIGIESWLGRDDLVLSFLYFGWCGSITEITLRDFIVGATRLGFTWSQTIRKGRPYCVTSVTEGKFSTNNPPDLRR